MNKLRNKVPSTILLYNIFNQTYFRYFYGHYVKFTNHVDSQQHNHLQNFIDNNFDKLSFSIDKYEKYLLWLFSKYGKLPIQSAFGHLEEYLKEEEKKLDISPFSGIITKYIREEKINNWKEYLLSQGNFYPKIIQHYMRDKNFPFEFILFLKILDRVPDRQKKMLKTIFRNEMYNMKEKLNLVDKNKYFFAEELKKINEVFE